MRLVGETIAFRHGQIERKLHEPEVMVVASSFPCYIGRFKKVDVVPRAFGNTESVPGRDSVAANPAFLDGSFQCDECIFKRRRKTSCGTSASCDSGLCT